MGAGAAGSLTGAVELFRFWVFPDCTFLDISTAVDDAHVPDDLFGGWIWVKAASRTKEAVLDALFQGAFYASSGPVIHDFGMDGDCVYVSCSDCREIHFVTYAPRGKSFFAGAGRPLTEASHRLTGKETYVRVACVDKNGHSAWSNPIFFDGRT